MVNIGRRTMIKTMGAFSLTGVLPLSAESPVVGKEKLPFVETDIVIVGGGTAGMIAAIQAGRAGCKTILVENGSQLGGTMTTGGVALPGLFHAWGKQYIRGIGWELVTDAVAMNKDTLPDFTQPFGTVHSRHQIPVNKALIALLAEEKCLQAGVNIRYYESPVHISRKGGKWYIQTVGKGVTHQIVCKQLIDCTGDASVTALAGYKRLQEKETQPGTLMFELGGYDLGSINKELIKKRYEDALKSGTLLSTDAYNGFPAFLYARGMNAQHVVPASSSTSELHTQANIDGRSSLLRLLRFIRTLPGCENTYIVSMQPETGIRETYRIEGEYRISLEDYVEGKIFEDSLCYSFYPIDLHDVAGIVPEYLSEGRVATIPLRALLPAGSKHLIVAGRCVSSDRKANSALRVQASCMAMGQVAGAVASLACKKELTPGNVPVKEVKELLEKHGGIVPPFK